MRVTSWTLHRGLGLGLLALGLVAGCECTSETEATVLPNGGGQGVGGDAGAGGVGGVGNSGGADCPSGIYCGPSGVCCDDGQECVNNMECLPVCANERCGANLFDCCEADQECLDGELCVPSCAIDEALCGEQLDTCCQAGDVCLSNACVTPGDPCDNNFDCLQEDWYCEETIGNCLPLPSGPLCEGDPEFNDIEPTLEWYWPGVTDNSLLFQNIIAAPAVGDVNGDGTPDVVVVAYAGTNGNNTRVVVLDGAGDGAGNGLELFTIPSAADPTAPEPFWGHAPALGNFDADPGLEIVYQLRTGGIRIADNTGVGDLGVRTSGTGVAAREGGTALADLNDDGMPDIITRFQAMDGLDISDPSLDLVNQSGCGWDSVVADLDDDGLEEIVGGNCATTADPNTPGGVPFWTNGLTAGFVAVADMLPDNPGPEVINIRYEFQLVDGLTGAVLIGPGGSLVNGTIPIPGGGLGGAPTVADFDGDGLPETSTAGQAAYVVYDPDCYSPPLRTGGQCGTGATNLILWSTPTQDLSSSETGSSVFDFQGDGPAEVLYNDECFFHIYDGTTGAELVDPVIPNSSRTYAEYPLVADVDGDGNAEMLVIGNQDQAIDRDNCDASWKTAGVSIDYLCQYTDCTGSTPCVGGIGGTCSDVYSGGYWDYYQCDSQGICKLPGGTHGVRVYGDAFDRWVKTRPVWNQFSYHVTNIEPQGGGVWDVPTIEAPGWLSYNNYRQNVQGGALFPVPDISIELSATPLCGVEVKLTATVYNVGSAGAAPGIDVHFYRTDSGATDPPEHLVTMTTTEIILPGGWERLTYVYPSAPQGQTLSFAASADPDNELEECDDDNNDAASDDITCEVPR